MFFVLFSRVIRNPIRPRLYSKMNISNEINLSLLRSILVLAIRSAFSAVLTQREGVKTVKTENSQKAALLNKYTLLKIYLVGFRC